MSLIIFIATLVILILVHEIGHFVSAKLFGIKITEFGIGFPPRIGSIKRGETRYSFNLLPLGGFVRVYGEEGEKKDDPRSFASRPAWQRFIVLASGVFMNMVLAAAVFAFAFGIGFPSALNGEEQGGEVVSRSVQIVGIAQHSPAEEAGLEASDIITNVQSTRTEESRLVEKTSDLQEFTETHKGEVLLLTIKRGGETIEKQVLARANPPEEEGSMGIVLADIGLLKFPWYQAIWKGIVAAGRNFWLILVSMYLLLSNLIFSGRVIGDVSGPVGIATMATQFYSLGVHYFLAFMGFISVNLAVLNILPIPALDGGRVLFLAIEKIKGSPVKPETEGRVHAAGFVLLIALIVFITVRDIIKL